MSWIVRTSVYSIQRDHNMCQAVAYQSNVQRKSDSLGLVDFAIRLVNSVFNWPDGEVMFFEEFK